MWVFEFCSLCWCLCSVLVCVGVLFVGVCVVFEFVRCYCSRCLSSCSRSFVYECFV